MRRMCVLAVSTFMLSAPRGASSQPDSKGSDTLPSPSPPPRKQGLTAELNLGIGLIHLASQSGGGVGVAGIRLDLAIGAWITPRLAITGRIAGAVLIKDSAMFLGPSAQYWVNDRWWLGGGIGMAALVAPDDVDVALGVDLRIGHTFSTTSANTFNVSLELTPGFYDIPFGDFRLLRATGIGFAVGYQHL